jgi:hypothetical protein
VHPNYPHSFILLISNFLAIVINILKLFFLTESNWNLEMLINFPIIINTRPHWDPPCDFWGLWYPVLITFCVCVYERTERPVIFYVNELTKPTEFLSREKWYILFWSHIFGVYERTERPVKANKKMKKNSDCFTTEMNECSWMLPTRGRIV